MYAAREGGGYRCGLGQLVVGPESRAELEGGTTTVVLSRADGAAASSLSSPSPASPSPSSPPLSPPPPPSWSPSSERHGGGGGGGGGARERVEAVLGTGRCFRVVLASGRELRLRAATAALAAQWCGDLNAASARAATQRTAVCPRWSALVRRTHLSFVR